MEQYSFRVVIAHQVDSNEAILELTDRLMAAGCDDGSLCGHAEGLEVIFDREATSRDEAMRSAVQQIESCGLTVKRVELDREAVAA